MKTKTILISFIGLLAISALVFQACKKDSDKPNTPPVYTNGQGEIGSAGGTVMIDDASSPINGASIVIPEGALNSNINIKIVEVPNEMFPPGDSSALLIGFEPEGLVFVQPVEISIPFKSGMNTSDMRVFYYNPDSMLVEQVPVVSYDGNFVTAMTNHFSYYYATDEGFILGIEMLNIDGKIGARVTNMGFDWIAGMNRIPSTNSNHDNAFHALVNSNNDVFSIFKAYLYKDGLFYNSMESVSNLTIRRNKNSGTYKADVYDNENFVYTSDALGTDPNGLLNTWFSGDPLIFYFDNFNPDASTSYFIKIKWRLHSNDNIYYLYSAPYTALYEVNNEDADKKLSEMGSFAFDDLFEGCIDEQYINGSGLKPGIITNEASLISCSSARLNGTLDNLGSGQITRHGFCLSDNPNPTVNDNMINLGAITELGNFSYDYSFAPPNLIPNTKYYYKAYAENSAGIGYGNEITFWTSDDTEAPTLFGYEPGSGETVSGNVYILISIEDGCGLDKAEFYVKPNGGNYTLIGEDPEPSYISNDVYHASINWNTNEFVNGTYTIKVLVNDMAGLLNNKTWDVIVNNSGSNTPPTALFTVSPSSGTTSTNFAFDASGCTDNETPASQLQVRWDFDGNGSWDTNWDTDKTQNHQYSSESTYQAKVEVKDAEGLTDTYTKSITVSNGGGGTTGTFTDPRDGQTYATIEIGNQTWFAENLNYETSNSWWYDNSSANGDVYGRLYTWEAALSACPSGWHLPSDEEWKTLEMALGMSQSQADNILWRGTDQGTQMKSTSGWYSNGNGTNSSGFNALPGGYRYSSGSFDGLGYYGSWWSATEDSGTGAWYRSLLYDLAQVHRYYHYKTSGFSVRCLKD